MLMHTRAHAPTDARAMVGKSMSHGARGRFIGYRVLLALCSVHAACCAALSTAAVRLLEAQSGRLTLSVDPDTGRYSISVSTSVDHRAPADTWLVSAPTTLHSDDGWVQLSAQNTSRTEGMDSKLGHFTRLAILVAGDGGRVQMETSFRVYHRPVDAGAVVVAEQRFITSAKGMKLGGSRAHDLAASAFPNWQVGAGLLGHRLQFIAGCDGVPSRSPVGTVFPHGYTSSFIGKGLPLALLDTGATDSSSALVLSPVGKFVSSTLALHNMSDGSQTLAAGIVGSVDHVPADYVVTTLITMSRVGGGFSESMLHWGDAMLALGGGKIRTKHNAAPMVSHLGYSTTAFYFYDPIAGKSYSDTILAVDAYTQRVQIPIHHYQLDSWWYGEYTGSYLPGTSTEAYRRCTNITTGNVTVCYSGTYRWDEEAATAPDRNALMGRFPEGLKAMTAKLGKRGVLSQHLGRWLPRTPYASDPRFVWESDNKTYAYSNDRNFWDWLVGNAKEWGMSTLKQDHTDSQLLQTPRCLEEAGWADSALAAQLSALWRHNCTLMGGGYTAKGWMHGSQHKALTHARLGGDYFGWCEPTNRSEYPRQWHPRCSHGNYWSWKVSEASLGCWALGARALSQPFAIRLQEIIFDRGRCMFFCLGVNSLYMSDMGVLCRGTGMAPYKDTFYSSSQETQRRNDPDTGFYMWHEPYPYTHAVVSAMTGGPILIGDGVNGSNRTLVMQTCTASGVLLKPDRPASPTDRFWLATLLNADAAACRGDLSVTHTSLTLSIASNDSIAVGGTATTLTWLYALGVQLCVPYSLTYGEWLSGAEPYLSSPSRSMQYEDEKKNDQDLKKLAPELEVAASVAFRPDDPVGTLVELPATGIETGTSSSITIAAGPDYGTADFWRTAPVLANGWALLGELDKFIGVSRQRITNLTMVRAAAGGSIKIRLVGKAGEVVHLSAASRENATSGGPRPTASTASGLRVAPTVGVWKLCTMNVVIGSDGSAESLLPPTESSSDCQTWSDQ